MSPTRPVRADRPAVSLRAETSPVVSQAQSPSSSSPSRKAGDRSSFVSVKEDDTGVAQTFLDSNTTTLTQTDVGGTVDHDDQAADTTMAATLVMPQPPSFCCPCARFRGWKQVQLRGRWSSRSVGDLRLLGGNDKNIWAWDDQPPASSPSTSRKTAPQTHGPGLSRLEALPTEILDQILSLLATDIPPNDHSHRNTDLVSCLLTSRTLHAATLTALYRNITIPHPLIFSKFLQHVSRYPALGTVVQRLDFSHFSSIGLGRTKRMNAELQMVTSNTLKACLDLTTRLREFLAQEHLEDDLDERVLAALFCQLPLLRALDFCGCSSASFKDAFTIVISRTNPALPTAMTLERLSLHECATLPASTFDILLPRLGRLTHLDVGHTQMTASALSSIPHTARLTHLNLSRCTRLAGDGVVEFITTHAAAKDSLVYLNLLADISRHRLLSRTDVIILLSGLPTTIRALNLSGAKMVSEDLHLLRPLMTRLEELSLGYSELTLDDIQSFYVPPPAPSGEDGAPTQEPAWSRPTLRYLDLTGIAVFTPSVLFSSSCCLLRPVTQPLEVLELGERVISGLHDRAASSKRVGWVVRELGRRGWYVREPPSDASLAEKDNGRRAWKMGAMWWGMKKVPVAWSEVGGLYGHYMFKK